MKKLVPLFMVIFIISIGIQVSATDSLTVDSMALYLGSPLTFSPGNIKALDSENPNVVPIIHMDRTLVPLRSISEHFGAAVSYNSNDRVASIVFGSKTYEFPINKSYYSVKEYGKVSKNIIFDTESLIIEDRTMVPLRVICEDILSKIVNYNDKVIIVSSKAVVLDSNLVEIVKSKIGQAVKVKSLTELNKIVSNIRNYESKENTMGLSPQFETSSNDKAISRDEASNSYSNTNEQVAGVNEADIVKTDGKFIYIANGNSINIVKSNNGNPEVIDIISMPIDLKTNQSIYLSELYIDSGRLVVLGSRNSYDIWMKPMPEPVDKTISIMPPIRTGKSYTYCGVYEINNNGNSRLLKEFEIEGSMLSNRKIDNVVYLVVNKSLNYYQQSSNDNVPMYRDTSTSNEYMALSIDNIMYYPSNPSPNYVIVAAIDIMDIKKATNIEALLGSGTQIYMSNEALYIAAQDYRPIWGSITNISKLTIDSLKIGFAGGGVVDGTILNQFSMDEYNGNLRIATTNWQGNSKNSLYILDENLNKISSIENLAPGEKIYSVRFIADKGYIVTFRQIDPLFVIDLSNPTSPRVTGELKVPGFSNYLHPLSKDILLGIGQHVDEKTGSQEGIKLSIFDVSNEGKPRELSSLILGGIGSYAEVLYNHKALMLNLENDMIAFDASLSNVKEPYQTSYFNGAVILEVNKNGDIKLLNQISNDGNYANNVKRLIYIDDVLYYIIDDQIRAFDINTFKEIK